MLLFLLSFSNGALKLEKSPKNSKRLEFVVFHQHVSFNRLFSASVKCLPSYQTTDDVKCQFDLKNNGDREYSVLEMNTPLNKISPLGLAVTRDGRKLKYGGMLTKHETPGRREFKTIAAGKTVSQEFNLSSGYDTRKAGAYTVAVDAYIEYAEGSVSSLPSTEKAGIKTKLAQLSSPEVSFQVTLG